MSPIKSELSFQLYKTHYNGDTLAKVDFLEISIPVMMAPQTSLCSILFPNIMYIFIFISQYYFQREE